MVSTAPDNGLKLVMTGNGFGGTGAGIFGWSLDFLQETESISNKMQKAGINFITGFGCGLSGTYCF